jgi:hypothetical protein
MDNIAGIDAFSRRMKRGGFFGPELRTRHSRISALDRLGEHIYFLAMKMDFFGNFMYKMLIGKEQNIGRYGCL